MATNPLAERDKHVQMATFKHLYPPHDIERGTHHTAEYTRLGDASARPDHSRESSFLPSAPEYDPSKAPEEFKMAKADLNKVGPSL